MDRAIKKAILLSWLTVVYNLLEGIVSVAFGFSDDSVALAGFGFDSLIEVASAFVILWRFRKGDDLNTASVERERIATLVIGVLFLLLAFITIGASAHQLFQGKHPTATLPGIIISLLSLSFMFWLWSSKKNVAKQLNSASMSLDAECSLSCIKLSGVLLAGNLVYLTMPSAWWADSVAAVIISGLIAKEGWESIQISRQPNFSGGCCSKH